MLLLPSSTRTHTHTSSLQIYKYVSHQNMSGSKRFLCTLNYFSCTSLKAEEASQNQHTHPLSLGRDMLMNWEDWCHGEISLPCPKVLRAGQDPSIRGSELTNPFSTWNSPLDEARTPLGMC